jgi:GNAT superfamily N-acetyltransferase
VSNLAPLLRDYRSEDAPALRELWGRIFPTPRGGQTVDWLFRPGPAGPCLRAVAELEGRVVSHAGVSSARYRIDGEEVRGGTSIGAMTDPSMRGRGLFVELGRYLYRRMEEQGFAFVAGFSNANSHRLMTGPLGRRALRPFPWCVRPLLPWPVSASGGKHAVRVVDCDPSDRRLDTVWSTAAASHRVVAVRDAAFAQWRFGSRPDAGYRTLLAEREGRPVGYAAHRSLELRGLRNSFVVDLLLDPDEPQAGPALLRAVSAIARSEGCRTQSALLPHSGPERRALRRGGFLRVPEALHPQTIRFSVRGLGAYADHPALGDPKAWLLSWADTDVV